MRRRSLLALLVPLTGCTSPLGTADTTTTDAPPDSPSPSQCSSVETDFTVPALSKPSQLTTETVRDPALAIERAYEDTIEISARTLPGVPDDATLDSFYLSSADAQTVENSERYSVSVGGVARYTIGGEANSPDVAGDTPITTATYEITTRHIRRESGIGDLTGLLVCW